MEIVNYIISGNLSGGYSTQPYLLAVDNVMLA